MSSNFDEEADVRGFLGDTQEEFEGESSNGGLEVITRGGNSCRGSCSCRVLFVST